jgi:hypothetical protein
MVCAAIFYPFRNPRLQRKALCLATRSARRRLCAPLLLSSCGRGGRSGRCWTGGGLKRKVSDAYVWGVRWGDAPQDARYDLWVLRPTGREPTKEAWILVTTGAGFVRDCRPRAALLETSSYNNLLQYSSAVHSSVTAIYSLFPILQCPWRSTDIKIQAATFFPLIKREKHE